MTIFLYSTTVNYKPRNKLTTTTVQTYTSHTHMELGSLVQAFNLRPWGPPAHIRPVVPRPYPPPSVGLAAGQVSPPITCPAPSAVSFAVLWSSYLASSFLLPAPLVALPQYSPIPFPPRQWSCPRRPGQQMVGEEEVSPLRLTAKVERVLPPPGSLIVNVFFIYFTFVN